MDISGSFTTERKRRAYGQEKFVICMILTSTIFERTAYYSLAANFMPSLRLSNTEPYSDDFTGSLIFSSRAKTIILGFILYIIGFVLTITFTYDTTQDACNTSNQTNSSTYEVKKVYDQELVGIDIALITIAIGAAALKSNLCVFAAEQSGESDVTARYYDKYFVAVNIGILTATIVIPYISETDGYNSRTIYIIGLCSIICATIAFLLGYKYYLHTPPYDSVITNCVPVISNAFRTWRKSRSETCLIPQESPETFLDYAKITHHGRFNEQIVDDVKCLRNAFMVFGLLIPYWMIYNQLYTSFSLQGDRMSGIKSREYVVSWMSLGDSCTVIIGIIILNVFVRRSVTILAKFVIGMSFASLTMFIAAGIEIGRQNAIKNGLSLSIYSQLGSTIVMGMGELFATVASYEFSYFAAPRSAQSLFMSLYFCTVGLGALIGNGLMRLFNVDFTDQPDYSPNYNYFFTLACIQLVFVVVLVLCQRKYQIIKLYT